jgi:hypothetical protein
LSRQLFIGGDQLALQLHVCVIRSKDDV